MDLAGRLLDRLANWLAGLGRRVVVNVHGGWNGQSRMPFWSNMHSQWRYGGVK